MKVYELMDSLAEMPAGAEVKIMMLKDLKEVPKVGEGLREIEFTVRQVTNNEQSVILDGWND